MMRAAALVVGLALVATAHSLMICKPVTMKQMTHGGNRQSYRVPGVTRVTSMGHIKRVPFSAECKEGESYGFSGPHIWVKDGCMAEFKVCGQVQPKKYCFDRTLRSSGEKSVSEMDGVVLSIHQTHRLPGRFCVFTSNFGFEGKNVWVDKNCNGVFKICIEAKLGELRCRNLNLRPDTETKESNPHDIKDIQSMEIKRTHSDSSECVHGDSYGFEGEKIWARKECRATFTVCGTIDPVTEPKRTDDIMQDMYGDKEKPKKTSELEVDLDKGNKERYQDKCKCMAWGDPHFQGFDGATIHFHDICEYTMARSTAKNLGDCAFDVTVENERRSGKESGSSFAKKVHIRMFGKEITLMKDNRVLFNGHHKPMNYYDKDFEVYTSGPTDLIFYAKECDVHVAFRRNHVVEVSTSKRYSGHMEGMCGNCNQDKADDLLLANGESPKSTETRARNAEIGHSWHVKRNRKGLPKYCDHPELQTEFNDGCDADHVKAAEEMCEPIRDEKGPFSECLKVAGTKLFNVFEGCTTDLCVFHKNEEEVERLRCRAFEVMALECNKLGINVEYRKKTNCDRVCPANYDYFDYVPECQPTCLDPEPHGVCLKRTTAGCMCAHGYLLDGEECIKVDECGCKTHDDKYISSRTAVLTNHCTKKHSCVYNDAKKTKTVKTSDFACWEHSSCGLAEEGIYKCRCHRNYKRKGPSCVLDQKEADKEKEKEDKEREEREKNMCECSVPGSTHYTRYDGELINFSGHCTYLLSGTKTTGGKCDFAVKSRDEGEGPTKNRVIYIETRDLLVEIKKGKIVSVNGETRPLPYESHEKEITIDHRGKYVELITAPECNVQVSFDGEHAVNVKIPKEMGENVVGICGNCNGETEYVTRDGQDVKDDENRNTLIGNSWKVTNPDGTPEPASCQEKEPEPACSEEHKAAMEAKGECGRLTDAHGPFAACHNKLKDNAETAKKMDAIFQSCLLDGCAHLKDGKTEEWKKHRCGFNEDMSDLCDKHGIPAAWRGEHFCPKACGPHSVYKPSMYGCQPNCAAPRRPDTCHRDEVEGCECKEGFVLDKGKCVTEEKCGCHNNDGDYVPVGSRWVSEDCSFTHQCVRREGEARLLHQPNQHGACHEKATCRLDPHRGAVCHCNEGFTGNGYECEPEKPIQPPPQPKPVPTHEGEFCLCKANGDPRVIQFDKGRLWVNNPCKYTLVKSDHADCKFSVEMKTVSHTKHTHMSYVYEIDVKHGDTTVRLGQNLKVQVKSRPDEPFSELTTVEDQQVNEKTWVSSNSTGVSVHTECGLVVLFDGNGEVTVTVPDQYAKTTEGLCGNCDEDQSNDRRDHHGRKPSHYANREEGHNAVARTHVVTDDSSQPDLSDVCAKLEIAG